mmetsp:Transcript_15195/g.28334  ORF Transcript_15195/g.28334 Transcript_15195/m.28334 type:complete len:207 (+) Transcript_15195:105-725(+)
MSKDRVMSSIDDSNPSRTVAGRDATMTLRALRRSSIVGADLPCRCSNSPTSWPPSSSTSWPPSSSNSWPPSSSSVTFFAASSAFLTPPPIGLASRDLSSGASASASLASYIGESQSRAVSLPTAVRSALPASWYTFFVEKRGSAMITSEQRRTDTPSLYIPTAKTTRMARSVSSSIMLTLSPERPSSLPLNTIFAAAFPAFFTKAS